MKLLKTFMAVLVAASVYSCTAGVPAYGQPNTTREETFAAIAADITDILKTQPRVPSLEAVVVVNTDGGSKGTATHIGSNRFLTAAHVIDGSDGGTITDYRGAQSRYVVVINDSAKDVAVIEIKGPANIPSRNVSCRTPAIGEAVEFIGHPMQWTYVYSWGRVASKPVPVRGFASGVWIAAAVAQGQSGSAVLDSGGNIVGIVNAGMTDSGGNSGYMLSVPGSTICSVLTIS